MKLRHSFFGSPYSGYGRLIVSIYATHKLLTSEKTTTNPPQLDLDITSHSKDGTQIHDVAI